MACWSTRPPRGPRPDRAVSPPHGERQRPCGCGVLPAHAGVSTPRAAVASIDTKKELIGLYHNGGREWRPKGEAEEVKVHDFIDRDLGKAIPTASAGARRPDHQRELDRMPEEGRPTAVEPDAVKRVQAGGGRVVPAGASRRTRQQPGHLAVEGLGRSGSGLPPGLADGYQARSAHSLESLADRVIAMLTLPRRQRPVPRQPRCFHPRLEQCIGRLTSRPRVVLLRRLAGRYGAPSPRKNCAPPLMPRPAGPKHWGRSDADAPRASRPAPPHPPPYGCGGDARLVLQYATRRGGRKRRLGMGKRSSGSMAWSVLGGFRLAPIWRCATLRSVVCGFPDWEGLWSRVDGCRSQGAFTADGRGVVTFAVVARSSFGRSCSWKPKSVSRSAVASGSLGRWADTSFMGGDT